MSQKPRVLIVDDEERLRNTMKKLLSIEGIESITAPSGREALEILMTEIFDVAILDVRMPEMTGVQLLTEVKKLDPTMEVLILTGYASVDTAKEIMKLGAFDYLLKPYDKHELFNKIELAYDRKIARKKLSEKPV